MYLKYEIIQNNNKTYYNFFNMVQVFSSATA
jgi:hypothetical protein